MRGLLIVLMICSLAACGEREVFRPQDVDVLVVDAVLTVDQPLPPVLLSRTLAPDVPYAPLTAGEGGATVWIDLEDGGRVSYRESVVESGRYLPEGPEHTVLPGSTYVLGVRTALGEDLGATTLTPPRLRVREWLRLDSTATVTLGRLLTFGDAGDTVYTAPENRLVWGDGLLEARLQRDPEVVAYQVALFSLDLDSDFAIDPDFFEPEDFESLERNNSSPMFEAREGSVRLPWFAVFFEGRYLVKVYATDHNWYDLVRTSPTLSQGGGFGGNAGDSFERPLFHVEGGIGLFGSASVDSVGFSVVGRER